MTREEKLEKVVLAIEEETDFEVIKEMKTILNKVFGEEYNQVIKPTAETIRASFPGKSGQSAFNNLIDQNDDKEILRWLKNNRPQSINYQIIIYFPDLVITDGKRKHKIKELYVRACVRPCGKMLVGISGVRASLSKEECMSSYVHSHLMAQSPDTIAFSSFCTGEGPINQVMLLLASKFSIPNFMLFCLHLKNFVVWESREGRPYMYIENIGKVTDSRRSAPALSEYITKLAGHQLIISMNKHLSREQVYEMLEFKVLPLEIEVKATKKFEIWANEIIKTWNIPMLFGTSAIIESFLSHVDNSGRYYSMMIDVPGANISYDPNKVLLQFKGKDVKLKIEIPTETKNTTIYETVPEKRITYYFCEKLSQLLTDAAFNNALVKTCSAGANNSETPESNPVHVQGSVDCGVVGNALL